MIVGLYQLASMFFDIYLRTSALFSCLIPVNLVTIGALLAAIVLNSTKDRPNHSSWRVGHILTHSALPRNLPRGPPFPSFVFQYHRFIMQSTCTYWPFLFSFPRRFLSLFSLHGPRSLLVEWWVEHKFARSRFPHCALYVPVLKLAFTSRKPPIPPVERPPGRSTCLFGKVNDNGSWFFRSRSRGCWNLHGFDRWEKYFARRILSLFQ